jgi:uncharacterized repeat protein (TIGR01451 family)/fimbrial isopeptide formation D2 family protein
MPISPSDFLVSLSPIPLQAVIGFDTTGTLSFSNTSLTDKAYNLTIAATIPDGVSFVSADLPPTQIVSNPDGTIALSWINIKDLAPNELNYRFSIVLHSDDVFRATGLPVPFDTPLVAVNVTATVDTLPRGNDDPGNVKISEAAASDFIPLRYNLFKSGPAKMPKGAGLLTPPATPLWPYTCTLTVQNNIRIPSTVTLIDNLPNGIRYLGSLTVSGPDSVALSAPTVTAPPAQDFVTLNWGTVTLSPSSTNVITFKVAIWNNYTAGGVENGGSRIPHLTALQNSATLNGLSGPVISTLTTDAMDATIDKSVASSSTDVGIINAYTLVYKINQYDPVNGFTITDTLGDGQSFIAGNPFPDSITVAAGITTLAWNIGNLPAGSRGTISFTSLTNADYVSPPGPVSAGDTLTDNASANGTNANFGTATPDSSGVALTVAIPGITKQTLSYFYKNGSPKGYNVAAPGDLVEFRLTYDASGIAASQLGILIDDFFPYNMGPLTGIPIIYGGTVPAPPPPVTIDPHGLRWTLGTLPGHSTFIATFQVPVENVNFVGSLNNLGKLSGNNTAGLAYSDRDQVAVAFGSPNITLNKTVTGPDINAIKAGETYTYSITIGNPENAANTTVDAFDIDLTDVIPSGLTYVPNSISVTGSGTFTPPVVAGQNVSLHILQLAPSGSLTLAYSVTVNPDIPAGGVFTNNANSTNPYSQPFTGVGDFQYSGQNRHAETTLRSKSVTLTKTSSPVFARIGDTVTYIITATVPQGTSAYNLQVVDSYPSATQLYLDNATLNGLPVTPVVAPGTVTFPAIPLITATGSDVSVVYTFDVRVTGGTHVPPFIENQNDNATVSWDISPGVPAAPVTVTFPLQVRTPNLVGRKEQRNVTTGGLFTAADVPYSPGDTVAYRINLTNNGAETAFNTVLTDLLNPLLSFNPGSFSANMGTPGFAAGTVTWNIPQIPAGGTATLTFTVTTLPGVAAGGNVPDSASFDYFTNNNGFEAGYLNNPTNTVRLLAPRVSINKNASPASGKIGDDITYTLTIVVPSGTIAYKVTVDDTLPVGQTYIGPATRQVPPNTPVIIPTSVIGQSVSFLDGNPDIDAGAGAVTVIYAFIARITGATHNPPFNENQTDSGRVRWAIVPGGSLSQAATATATVNARTPDITILKEQQNVSTGGGFTTANISGLPGDTVYYRFTVTSNGASPAYNIVLSDVLDPFLSYNGLISVSTGTVTPPGPSLVWNIPFLDNTPGNNQAVLVFSVTITAGIGAGGSIIDRGTAAYDSNDVNPVTYNASSNSTTINIPSLTIDKSAVPASAALGDTITYTIKITIPAGVTAHNLVITDFIPAGQTYVPGSWTPGPPPVQTFNTLTFSDPVTPETGPLTLTYTFQTTVTGVTTPPYSEIQTNSVQAQWNITPAGPAAPPVSASADVQINTPSLSSIKEQRNASAGGSFTTGPLLGVAAGNIIEYRLTLTNNGAGTAYNVSATDVLDPALTYQGVVGTPPPGSVSNSVPAGNPDGTLTWNNFSLPAGASAMLTFQVLVNPGFPPGSRVTDQTATTCTTNAAGVVTLGPVLSNEVAFNFTLPLISKTADRTALFLGDTVTYTVSITIPQGNIAYHVQVTDSLPSTQTYVPDSLTRNGIPVIPSPTLAFPPEGTIDATAGDVTVDYTFQATVTSIAAAPQDAQTDTATISWTFDPAGLNPGPPQTATETVYVTNSDITIGKEQKLAGSSYTTNVLPAAPGSQVFYRLTVGNPGTSAVFNVAVSDHLSSFLQFNSIVAPPPAGVITHSGGPAGGTVNWNIAVLPAATAYQAEFSVTVLPGAGAESLIPDNAQATFNATSTPPLTTYGPRLSNTVNLQLPSILFDKSSPSNTAEVGAVISYSLTITVPAGVIAYNLVVTDTLPAGQTYADNATRNGLPITPSVSGQIVAFPVEPAIDATGGQLTVTYVFLARIVSGNTSPPYTEVQTNSAAVTWDTDIIGTHGTPKYGSQDITVTNPFSFVTKEQSNVTRGTGFITTELSVSAGDVVRYKLDVFSQGASPAYNVVVTDILGPFKKFLNIVAITAGTATGGGTVTWTIPEIRPGTFESLVFDIQVLGGISAGGTDSNLATELYDSHPTTPVTYGPVDSNIVLLKYPNVRIHKTADHSNAAVGNTITYTVTFVLPRGTVAYNGQFTDTIPVGQVYGDHATLNGVPVAPQSVSGQVVVFPAIPFASAGPSDLSFVYTFRTIVVSANVNPVTLTEIQTNEAVGRWYLDPETPAPPVNDLVNITVTDSSVQIDKAQRNVSRAENFTAGLIRAGIGETVEYRLTVTNTGPNTVYNIVSQDSLAPNLRFINTVSVSAGTVTFSGGGFDGTVTFIIPALSSGASATAIIAAQVAADISVPIKNLATGTFNILPGDPTPYQAVPSNVTVIEPERAIIADCILVNKVYDQCFSEDLVTSQIPVVSACPGVTIPAGATVGCIPVPGSATCSFAGTVAVTPPLTPFFEEVLVINSFDVVAPVFAAGVTVCAPTLTLTGAARAVMWAPPGTTVTCDILSFGDCSCTLLAGPTGLPTVLVCTGKVCKEIQVTAPVKLLVPSYGFCKAGPPP